MFEMGARARISSGSGLCHNAFHAFLCIDIQGGMNMSAKPIDLKGKKILVSGVTSQVALPVARHYAKDSEVWGLARFADAKRRAEIDALGVRSVAIDLSKPDEWGELPTDFDYVLNYAVVKSGDFVYDLASGAEGVGDLIAHCGAKAFLHCSSTAVYQYEDQTPRSETSNLGDNHRYAFPTYSIGKIAAECVARFAARRFKVPTIIARLNVPYGRNGGWPLMHLESMEKGEPIIVHPEQPNFYNPIHENDIIGKVPNLLAAAAIPAPTINFGGFQQVSVEDWCGYLQELTGFEPKFQTSPGAFGSLCIDPEKMHQLIGPTETDWQEGLRDMVEHRRPDLLKAS